MRCLALAQALRNRGAQVLFISREYPGNACSAIVRFGFALERLPVLPDVNRPEILMTQWSQDAQETAAALQHHAPKTRWNWLILDHYGLDAQWEMRMMPLVDAIGVIDDLANREHCCAMLLDQNLQQGSACRYAKRVPARCHLLLGPRYALLRSEFQRTRRRQRRRSHAQRQTLCISLGGTDPTNTTARVLRAMERVRLVDWRVDVIVGAHHKALREVSRAAKRHRHCTVYVNPPDIASIVAGADLAVGAAGVSLWERCCLGVPSMLVAQAQNQIALAQGAVRAGVATYLGPAAELSISRWVIALHKETGAVRRRQCMARRAAALVDGAGAQRVAEHLMSNSEPMTDVWMVRSRIFGNAKSQTEYRRHD